jgi:ribosomal-protein-alanine N-acetyltransferase
MSGPARVGSEHAPALALLHASSFPAAERWSATVISLQLSAPGGFGFADSRGGMILGRAIGEEAEVLTLAVEPGTRRRGLGAGLLRSAMAHAAAAGATAMFLEVAVTNLAAIGLYRGLGFAVVGERRRYYADGTDALVMRRSLCPPVVEGGREVC